MKQFLPILTRPVIMRDQYVDELYTDALTQQIVFLVWSRRVGKSSIISALYQKYQLSNCFYLNIELDSTKSYQTLQSLNEAYELYVQEHGDPEWIIIDEIQYIPDWQYFVRARYASKQHKIIITGSHSSVIHHELSTYFTGRYIAITVYPLTYSEFLMFTKQSDSSDVFDEYLYYGWLPEVALLPKEKRIIYLKQVFQSLVYEDVIKYHHISNSLLFEKVLCFVSDSIGSELSINSIANYIKQEHKISADLVGSYIKASLDAFLIHKHDRYDIRGKKILEFYEKYYFYDHGIRNMIRGMRPDDTGKLLENIVCNELLVRWYQVLIGKQYTHEIDFVAQKEWIKTYIQVAQQIDTPETYAREFGNLESIREPWQMYVLSMSGTQSISTSNIPHYPIRQRLLNK